MGYLGLVRAAFLFYPWALWSLGARRGPRPWGTPHGEEVWAYVVDVEDEERRLRMVRAAALFYPPARSMEPTTHEMQDRWPTVMGHPHGERTRTSADC